MKIPRIPIPAVVRTYKWRFLIGGVGALLLLLIIMAATSPKQPEYVTAVAERGDLLQTVEAVGTVTSEKALDLQFRSSGIVGSVNVKEGDRVKAGQTLASLRAGAMGAAVQAASARLQEARANLQALEEGARPEDIAVAEAQLANKRASLEVAKSALATAEANVTASQTRLDALRGETDTSVSTQLSLTPGIISQKLTTADQAMSEIDAAFANNNLQDAVVRANPAAFSELQSLVSQARSTIQSVRSSASASATTYDSAVAGLQATRNALTQASTTLDRAYQVISDAPLTAYFTSTDQSAYKSDIAAQRTLVQTALRDTDSATQNLKQTPSGADTRVAAEEANLASAKGARDRAKADITTYQTSIQIDEAQLALKKAPARSTDLAAAQARVRSAQADVASASSNYSDTLITAPVAGIVTRVDLKPGEISPVGSSITMVGDSPYRVEMFVSEIDVPKVMLSQSGSIELDAFRGTNYALRVSEVDHTPTDKDGVSKYRVKLDFAYPHDELKIGMTGDASIVTGMKKDVVSVPLRAVIEDEMGRSVVRVLKKDGKTIVEKEVTTGLEGGDGNVEVTGVGSGETIVVLIKE